MFDLLVAGGGPAGLASAIFGAQRGMRVAVVEPRRGAIDKACGEGIMPGGRQFLDKMGVHLHGGKPILGVQYRRMGRIATGRFREGPGIGIRRKTLSSALWERAVDLGVERLQGRVRDVALLDQKVSALGIEARWLVAADGLHSMVAKSLGMRRKERTNGRYGVRRHYRMASTSDFVEVYLGDTNEAYVTPVADDVAGVAILSNSPAEFETSLSEFPELRMRLGAAITSAQGAGPFGQTSSRLTFGRAMLVGDAAGFLDPITGEGIRLSFASAQWAIDCISRNCIDEYEAGWQRLMRRYQWVTASLLQLRRNRYSREALVPVLKAVPAVFDRMLGLLAAC